MPAYYVIAFIHNC